MKVKEQFWMIDDTTLLAITCLINTLSDIKKESKRCPCCGDDGDCKCALTVVRNSKYYPIEL